MYISQQKWVAENWKNTLAIHARGINALLERCGAFDLWKKTLSSKYDKVAKELITEIFMDSYLSTHFACMGLYKQANVCLRSQLETSLRLVYFSTHPVEFIWWSKGSTWYLESKFKDVWGPAYQYFEKLEEVESFDKACSSNKLFASLNTFYKKLSKYVHGSVSAFQTTPNRIAPKYDKDEFGKWETNFKDVQKYANTILVLGFANVFKTLTVSTQRGILKAVEDRKYKEGLRKSLGLRFRGRI
jgi:hypothetical protein